MLAFQKYFEVIGKICVHFPQQPGKIRKADLSWPETIKKKFLRQKANAKQLKLKTILQNLGMTVEGGSDGLRIPPKLVAVDTWGLGGKQPSGDVYRTCKAPSLFPVNSFHGYLARVNYYCLQSRILLDALTFL